MSFEGHSMLADLTNAEFIAIMGSIIIPVVGSVVGLAWWLGRQFKAGAPMQCNYGAEDSTAMAALNESHHGAQAKDADGRFKWHSRAAQEKETRHMISLHEQSVRLQKETLKHAKKTNIILIRLFDKMVPEASAHLELLEEDDN